MKCFTPTDFEHMHRLKHRMGATCGCVWGSSPVCLHSLPVPGCAFKMLREAKLLFGQFSMLHDRTPCCDSDPASTPRYQITHEQTTRLSSWRVHLYPGDKKSNWKPGMSGMCSVCACRIPRGFHLKSCLQSHQGCPRAWVWAKPPWSGTSAEWCSGRGHQGSRCTTKADWPDASFRLDPFWKFWARINFWLGKKKRLFPTYCLRNWEKGKGVGREEEEGKNIVIIT